MALCTGCTEWLEEVFGDCILPQINKAIPSISFRELRDICKNFGSPSGDPARGNKELEHVYEIVRRDADMCTNGSACWLCVWVCYGRKTMIMFIGQPKDLRVIIRLHVSLINSELLAWLDFEVADYRFLRMDIGKLGSRARFRARSQADHPQRVYTYKFQFDDGGRWRKLSMSRQQGDGVIKRGISKLPDTVVRRLYPSFTDTCLCTNSTEVICNCRVANIQNWVQQCHDTHEVCNLIVATNSHNDEAEGRKLPSRLISVGVTDAQTKLMRTGDLDASAKELLKYATLSHCWGQSEFLTLTEENFSDFLRAIPVEALAKTFQEAIAVCRRLGIEYIWIDCLCIVQNSAGLSDWRAEAGRMQHVYGNSFLNLSASASRGSHEGLVTPRNTAFLDDLEIKLPGGLEAYPSGNASQRRRAHEACPLFKRGWVLQECFLAPRVLHFTQSQLTWQCKHSSSTEFDRVLTTSTGPLGPVTFEFRNPIASITSAAQLDGEWARIASDYSWTRVTNAEDRYNALAGLAAQFSTRFAQFGVRTRYLAGLWGHDLPRFLCFQDNSKKTALRANVFTPSWSWLRLRAISNEHRRFTDRADSEFTHLTVVPAEIEYTLQYPDLPYGPVSHARIRLTASFFQLSFRLQPNDPSLKRAKAILYGGKHPLEVVTDHDADNMFFSNWVPDEEFRDSSSKQQELTHLCMLLTADSNAQGWCVTINSITVMSARNIDKDGDQGGDTQSSGDSGKDSDGGSSRSSVQDLSYRRTGFFRINVYPKHQIYRNGEFGRFFSEDNLLKQSFWLV